MLPLVEPSHLFAAMVLTMILSSESNNTIPLYLQLTAKALVTETNARLPPFICGNTISRVQVY